MNMLVIWAAGDQLVSSWWVADEQLVTRWWASGEQLATSWWPVGEQLVAPSVGSAAAVCARKWFKTASENALLNSSDSEWRFWIVVSFSELPVILDWGSLNNERHRYWHLFTLSLSLSWFEWGGSSLRLPVLPENLALPGSLTHLGWVGWLNLMICLMLVWVLRMNSFKPTVQTVRATRYMFSGMSVGS